MKVEEKAMPEHQPENDVRAQVLSHGGEFGAYNVVAAYGSPQEAQQAMQALHNERLPESEVTFFGTPGPATKRAVKRSDGKLTSEVTAWAIGGTLLGGVLGVFGGLVLGAQTNIPWYLGLLWGTTLFSIAGAILGGQLGILFSRGSDESRSVPGVLVGVRSESEAPVKRAADVMARLRPTRLWRLDRNGNAL